MGDGVAATGWTAVPTLLYDGAPSLGLARTDVAVIVALASFDWHGDGSPAFPRKARLAATALLKPTAVTASLVRLERAGLVEIHTRQRRNGSQTTNGYTLAGLLTALDLLALNPDGDRTRGLSELLTVLREQGAVRHADRVQAENWRRRNAQAT